MATKKKKTAAKKKPAAKKKAPAKKKPAAKANGNGANGPVRPNKTRKISQGCRAYYKGDRSKIPLRHFLEKDRDYPYRTTSGRIDCNMVSAAIKRARLNKGQPGAAAVLKKAQAIWNRVCRKLTDDASQ